MIALAVDEEGVQFVFTRQFRALNLTHINAAGSDLRHSAEVGFNSTKEDEEDGYATLASLALE